MPVTGEAPVRPPLALASRGGRCLWLVGMGCLGVCVGWGGCLCSGLEGIAPGCVYWEFDMASVKSSGRVV